MGGSRAAVVLFLHDGSPATRFLVDPATLAVSNRWRRERGEPELRISDIAGAGDTPGST